MVTDTKIKFAHELMVQDAARIRPINCNKMYAWSGDGIHHAFDRFTRLFFGGVAAARHHRPHPEENPAHHLVLSNFGLGLSPWAQVSIRSIRMLSDEIHFPSLKPDHSFSLLPGRQSSHETYAMSSDDKSQYLVLVQSGSPQSVSLDLSQSPVSSLELKWLDVFDNSWTEETTISAGGTVTLQTPGNTKASLWP